MRLIVENRFALLGLVALALATLFGVAFATAPVEVVISSGDTGTARPESAVRVCPPPHEDGAGHESSVVAFAPRVTRNDDGGLGGSLLGAGEPVGEDTDEPGRPWRAATGEAGEHVVVRAEGTLAAGLEVAQTTVGEDGATEARCAEPAISTWFALPGGSDPEGVELDGLRLHLANTDEGRAVVNVDLYTADGPAFSQDTRGVQVPPLDAVEVDLRELAANTGALGVHVRTNAGRAAASLLAEHSDGGRDWVPPALAPAEELVVPGVPGGEGARRLIVAAPGEEKAVGVRVRVLTPPEPDGDGEEDAPEAGAEGEGPLELSIPPAASAWLSLEGVLGQRPATLVLEADGPVVAGVVAQAPGGGDTAYSAAAAPLAGPLDGMAVVPDTPAGTETELLFGAPREDAALVATPVEEDGTTGNALRVEIPAGHTFALGPDTPDWDVPREPHTLRLELTDGSGPVYAARVLRTEEGAFAAVPVRPAPVELRLPATRHSLVGIVP